MDPLLDTKQRAIQMLRSEVLPKVPPLSLSLNPYQQPDAMENELLMASPIGYMRLRSSFISSGPRVFVAAETWPSSDENMPSLNPPVTETIIWEKIRPYIPPERWEVVENVLDPECFRKRVLLTDEQDQESCKLPSFPKCLQEELLKLGYVRRARKPAKCLCRLFCVPRPDKKLRLIWDGRNLNKRCARPPTFHLRTTLDHVKDLFRSTVHAYYVLDMRTWFCQLKPHPEIAQYFGTKLKNGVYILVGLPMGWAWAPIVAQFTAEGVAAVIAERLPQLQEGGVVVVYIDNLILGLPESLMKEPLLVAEEVRRACESVGAVIKEGSQKFGTRVEWLGVEIDCTLKKLRLKKTFIHKLFVATSQIRQTEVPTEKSIRQWYAITSCIIYSMWNTEGSLWQLHVQIRWMSDLSRMLLERNEEWESLTVIPEEVLKDMKKLLRMILKNDWKSLPVSIEYTQLRAVGFSDASNASLAWAFHTEKEMRLQVEYDPSTNENIFERELSAMVEGQKALVATLPPMSSYAWGTDNMGALFVSRRELSCLWKMNAFLRDLHEMKDKYKVVADLFYIESEKNPADKPSRLTTSWKSRASACSMHPGKDCFCFHEWISTQCGMRRDAMGSVKDDAWA